MIKSNEEYQNIIELLKIALEFYADRNNYEVIHPITGVLVSRIEIDGGSQAEFALKQLKNLEEYSQKMENDFVKFVETELDKNETTEDVLKTVKVFKKLSDDNNV
jgi:hypothetical protein